MDRRTFTLNALIVTPIALSFTSGCKGRLRSYDTPPKRALLEDRWPGHYFDRVHATYALKLMNPAPSLFRTADNPIPIVSGDGRSISSLAAVPTIRPKHATVELTYEVATNATAMHEMEVTLHWPDPDAIEASRTFSETRTAEIGFEDIKDFLEGAGRFRVDPEEHFYGDDRDSQVRSSTEYNELAINVKLAIRGPNREANFSRTVSYRNGLVLYRLAERAWPGIG